MFLLKVIFKVSPIWSFGYIENILMYMFRLSSLIVVHMIVSLWLLPTSKLLDLPVINLFSFFFFKLSSVVAIKRFPTDVCKYLRTQMIVTWFSPIIWRVHDILERLWILITKRFGFKSWLGNYLYLRYQSRLFKLLSFNFLVRNMDIVPFLNRVDTKIEWVNIKYVKKS